MAEVRISDLQERADIDLTDFFAVDNATSTRKLAMTTLLSHIANSYQKKTDNSLETTDKTVVGAINELNSDLTDLQKNNAGNYVNISAYSTFANAYVCPSDGYALVDNHGASDMGYITVYGANAATDDEALAEIANRTEYEVMSLYVRKGCKLVTTVSAGTPHLRFYPLV